MILPYASLYADGYLNGNFRTREKDGVANPAFYYSMNFYGAPVLPWRCRLIVIIPLNYLVVAESVRIPVLTMMRSASPGNIDGAVVFKSVVVFNSFSLLYSAV